MMAIFIAVTAVVVERLINKRRLRLHEVLADVGWLTLLFAFIEFGYLYFVEALTISHKDLARPLWYTIWQMFKSFLLDTAIAVLLILTSVWIESAGIHVVLRQPRLRVTVVKSPPVSQKTPDATAQRQRCDIEWREAS